VQVRINRPGGNHFSERQWGDFVRGLASETDTPDMQTHIDSGCSECRSMAERLGAVARLAATDRGLDIPAEVVARAQAIFDPVSPQGWIETLQSIAAELVSSVSADWQPAGVRSAGTASDAQDRLLYRAGDYFVELKLEPPSAGEAGDIVGQIANEHDPGERLEGVLVQIVVSGRTLGETSTNRFGEFLMDYPAKKSAVLRFALKHSGRRIDLPLKLGKNPDNPY